jgi:hypothetical protein
MNKKRISEATGSSSSGKFKVPLVLAPELWKKNQLVPFTNQVSNYSNAELAYEEMDGNFKETPQERAKIENKTKKLSKLDQYLKQFYTSQNDEDGGNIADIESSKEIIDKVVRSIKEENSFLKEDLAVWFGTKKKPKGSKQPAGPWVNICSKKEGGGHPPCGRSEAKDSAYPKCRARSVASKMTDSQKKSACSQKRREEKSHSKSGTGNQPKMVSYKPRKTESLNNLIRRIIKEHLSDRI